MSRTDLKVTSVFLGAAVTLAVVGMLWGGRARAQEAGAGEPAERPLVSPGNYVGVDACKKCHFAKHKTWKKSHHPDAFEAMPQKYRSDPNCLECHVTGLGQPGGFVSLAQTPKLAGVQCEMCHGPGKQHAEFMKQNEAKKTDPAVIEKGRALFGPFGGVAGARSGCYRCHLMDSHDKHPKFDR